MTVRQHVPEAAKVVSCIPGGLVGRCTGHDLKPYVALLDISWRYQAGRTACSANEAQVAAPHLGLFQSDLVRQRTASTPCDFKRLFHHNGQSR